MGIDPLAAVITGVLAAQVMEIPAYTQRAAGAAVYQDVFAEAGAILRAPPRYQRLAGWAGHALLAVAIMFMLKGRRPEGWGTHGGQSPVETRFQPVPAGLRRLPNHRPTRQLEPTETRR